MNCAVVMADRCAENGDNEEEMAGEDGGVDDGGVHEVV